MAELFPLSDAQKTIMDVIIFSVKSNKIAKSNVILDFYFQVKENCDFIILEKAYQYVMENNDSLRLFFFKKGLKTVQKILPWDKKKPEEVILDSQDAFEEFYKNISHYELPIFNNNPIRCFLVKIGESGALVFRAHHLLIDGYGVNLLLKQLETFYSNEIEGKETQYKTTSIQQYFDSNKRYHKTGLIKTDRKYWKKQHLHQRKYHSVLPWRGSQASLTTHYEIDEERNQRLKSCYQELLNNNMISIQSLISYLVGLTIFRLSGKENFAFSNISHGRRNFALKKCIGNMAEAIPTYFDFKEEETLWTNFFQYNERYYDNMTHGQLPLKDHILLYTPIALKDKINFQHFWWLEFSSMENLGLLQTAAYKVDFKAPAYMGFPFYIGMNIKSDFSIVFDLQHQKKRFPKEKTDYYWCIFLDTIDLFIKNIDKKIGFVVQKKEENNNE